MSNNYGPEIKYNCSQDCSMGGCSGHTAQVQAHLTSDTVSIWIDRQQWIVFNDAQWNAILNSYEKCGKERGWKPGDE